MDRHQCPPAPVSSIASVNSAFNARYGKLAVLKTTDSCTANRSRNAHRHRQPLVNATQPRKSTYACTTCGVGICLRCSAPGGHQLHVAGGANLATGCHNK